MPDLGIAMPDLEIAMPNLGITMSDLGITMPGAEIGGTGGGEWQLMKQCEIA